MIILIRNKKKRNISFCGYIGNNYYPKPLNAKEEKEKLLQWQAGDEEARNILIERNLRLVVHVCKKYEQSGVEKDDLISIGTIGLIKAINSYSMDRGVRLATYAARCIDNEVLMYFRQSKNSRQEVSIHEPLGFDKEGNEVTLIDVLGTDKDSVIDDLAKLYEREEILKKVDLLSPREKTVLNLRYGLRDTDKFTQKEVGGQLGISRSYSAVIIGIKLVSRMWSSDFISIFYSFFIVAATSKKERSVMASIILRYFDVALKAINKALRLCNG